MSQKTNPALTVTVHIKLLGFLTQHTDRPEMAMEVRAGTTVAQVIGRLGQQLGQRFQQAILDEHGNLHGGIEVILNRQQISARRISQVEIGADSELVLIPLVGGGYV